jgi:hypothetical protein
VKRRFRGKYDLHLQGRNLAEQETSLQQVHVVISIRNAGLNTDYTRYDKEEDNIQNTIFFKLVVPYCYERT